LIIRAGRNRSRIVSPGILKHVRKAGFGGVARQVETGVKDLESMLDTQTDTTPFPSLRNHFVEMAHFDWAHSRTIPLK
jgi:hypothetical protein